MLSSRQYTILGGHNVALGTLQGAFPGRVRILYTLVLWFL